MNLESAKIILSDKQNEMLPTLEQLQTMYVIGRNLTAQLRCYIQLIDLLPNGDLCIVSQQVRIARSTNYYLYQY